MLISTFIKYIDFRLRMLKARNAFFKKYNRKPKSRLKRELKKQLKKAKYERYKQRTI